MTPEQILEHPPRVLSQSQREAYFEDGFLGIQSLVDADTLSDLNAVAMDFVDQSREETASGDVFDLAPGHSREHPRMRRLKCPDDRHSLFWSFATGQIADLAADLVGPDVVFHHSKLNFKWNDGHDDVAWHQDIQFYPHTNYSPLTIGVYLQDTFMEDGPLAFIPGSHAGELFDQYGDDAQWKGCLSPRDVATLDLDKAVHVQGPAGSVTVHNCRTVHGSPPNRSANPRPLLLYAFTSADAFPYTPHPQPSSHTGTVVRGARARWAHHDPRPCLIPPDWSGGYTSIFAAQAGEEGSGGRPGAAA